MEKFDEISWPSNYVEINRIEELLKCGICYEFIETTVMTPCSHNYCSLCIRKYLHYKTQCPACFQTTFEKDLQTNRILDEIITHFTALRDKLVDCISGTQKIVRSNNSSNDLLTKFQPTRPPRTNHCQKATSKFTALDDMNKSLVNNNSLVTATTEVSVSKSLSLPCTSESTSNISIENKSNGCERSDTQVSCPICQVQISHIHINKHLDECIKRDSIEQKDPPKMNSERKLLPKLVVNLLKDSELKKKMKQLNLPIQGDRRTLEHRFQRYCTLYNAECDKIKPRSVAELLKQCRDEELLEKKLEKSSLTTKKIKVSRNSEQNLIDEANSNYLKMNAENYQNLIDSIKNREKHKKINNDDKLNDESAKKSLNDPALNQECDKPISSSPNNSMTFKHNDSCSSDPSTVILSNKNLATTIRRKNKKLATETNSCMDNCAQNESTEMIMINSVTIQDCDNKQLDINKEESSSPNNCCFLTSHTIRKRNYCSAENSIDSEFELLVNPNISSNASLCVEILQRDEDIINDDKNYTENNDESSESDDCTMKRRRRQKEIALLNSNEINPPSRPARKRCS